MTYAQDKAALDHATPIIQECELALREHRMIALDNLAPETDFVWPTHQMMMRAGMRVVTGEHLAGRPFVVVDCSGMQDVARASAETKRQMLAECYGVIGRRTA